ILRQIHPDITLHGDVGFEAVDLPADWFDLAISNVPFGDMPIHDPLILEPLLRRTIHDYFFAKALRVVRSIGWRGLNYRLRRSSWRRACCSWSWRAASTASRFSCAHSHSERSASSSVVPSGVSAYS